jgi:hypothetical protein
MHYILAGLLLFPGNAAVKAITATQSPAMSMNGHGKSEACLLVRMIQNAR